MDLFLLLKALPVYLLLAVAPGVALYLGARPAGSRVSGSMLMVFSAFSHVLLILPVYLLGEAGILLPHSATLSALALAAVATTILWQERQELLLAWRQRPPLWIWAGLLLVFVPMLSVRAWFGGHGFWHGVVIEHLLTGGFPPDNPGFVGVPHHYPWMFHLWYAALVSLTGLHYTAFKVLAMGHMLAVMLALCLWVWQRWGYSRQAGMAAFGLLLGSLNIGAFIQLMPALASWLVSARGFAGAFWHHVEHTTDIPLLSLTHSMGGVRVFDHGWSYLAKFYNVNGMVHGFIFAMVTLWGVYLVMEDDRDRLGWATFFFALLGLGMFYPVFGLLVVAIALAGMIARGGIAGVWPTPRQWRWGLGLGAVAGALLTPYFLSMGQNVGSTTTPVFQFAPAFSQLWYSGVGAYWPLLPLLLVAMLRAPLAPWPRLWLESGLVVTLLLAATVPLFGGADSYKYLFITGFFLSWRLIPLWFSPRNTPPPRWRGQRLAGVLVTMLALGPILLTSVGWSLSAWFRDDRLHVEGQRLLYRPGSEAGAPWQWLADHVEAGSALSHPPTRESLTASVNYLPALLARRPAWFVMDRTFTGSAPDVLERIRLNGRIWGMIPQESGASLNPARLWSGPLYLVHGTEREDTMALYRDLMGSVAELPDYPGEAFPERLRELGFAVREVFRAGPWRVLRFQAGRE